MLAVHGAWVIITTNIFSFGSIQKEVPKPGPIVFAGRAVHRVAARVVRTTKPSPKPWPISGEGRAHRTDGTVGPIGSRRKVVGGHPLDGLA